jgi:hypothetical protein
MSADEIIKVFDHVVVIVILAVIWIMFLFPFPDSSKNSSIGEPPSREKKEE